MGRQPHQEPALAAGRHRQPVELAQALGVTGVPLIAMRPAGGGWDDAVALSGAQPEARVLAAAQRVLEAAQRNEGRPAAPEGNDGPAGDESSEGPSCAA